MIRNRDLIEAIEQYAPLFLAEDWDHPGLCFGSYEASVKNIYCALDMTTDVVNKAIKNKADFLIVHHPPLFNPVHMINDTSPEGKMQLDLIRNNISCYSAHTNLDRVPNGTAGALARKLDLPVDEKSYQTLEKIDNAHNYGYGLFASLKDDCLFFELDKLVAERLRIPACERFSDKNSDVKMIALFPGSFDLSFTERLLEIKADVLITGEVKHHEALILEERNIRVLSLGHDVSEREVMFVLANYLKELFPELLFEVDRGIEYN